jgi:hypothetical protein
MYLLLRIKNIDQVSVAHPYNPSYFGRLRSGGLWFENSIGKKFVRPPSQPIAGYGGMCLSSQLQWEV